MSTTLIYAVNTHMILDDVKWKECEPKHLWIYDKLILSRKLGYLCGPSGVEVPKPGTYVVRPITNIEGMGIGAKFQEIYEDTWDIVPPGYFWCEVFAGRHLSVDYFQGQQILCVEGIRDKDAPLYKWKEWKKVDDVVPFPTILKDLPYDQINCEFIGGNLIEVHLRLNPDFINGYDRVYPVWENEDTTPPEGFWYKEDKDFKRLGFFIPK